MSDQPPAPAAPGPPATPLPGQAPAASAPPEVLPPAQAQADGPLEGVAAIMDERPEVAAGAAFAAGFVCAMILRRLAR